MVTAAATATVNNIPLLLFMGDAFASRQPDPVLQQVEQLYNPTVTTADAFKAVSRYFDKITRPEMIMSSLTNAMRVLTDPAHTGAVALALAQDVQGESYDYPAEFFRKRTHLISRAKPDDYAIKIAAKAVRKAKKPLLIVGGGVRYSEAGKEVAAFCEKHPLFSPLKSRRYRRHRQRMRQRARRASRPDHRRRHALYRLYFLVQMALCRRNRRYDQCVLLPRGKTGRYPRRCRRARRHPRVKRSLKRLPSGLQWRNRGRIGGLG